MCSFNLVFDRFFFERREIENRISKSRLAQYIISNVFKIHQFNEFLKKCLFHGIQPSYDPQPSQPSYDLQQGCTGLIRHGHATSDYGLLRVHDGGNK